MKILLFTIFFSCFIIVAYTQDPAPGWTAYAKITGGGKRITQIEAKWKVPNKPTEKGLFFGIWFGIEPNPAMNLIQPVLPWDGDDHWLIYNEYYQWNPTYNYDSHMIKVQPGQIVYGSVTYVPGNNSYTMKNSILGGESVSSSIAIQLENGQPKVYTDAYFVLEKVASNCKQYPPEGVVTFYDISVSYENVVDKTPAWSTHVLDAVCGSTAHILNSTTVSITWNN
eukprot:TRINITY_DN3430_c0_g1_i1.p1 TRINITY_DN3430_c0_g1~~TRINITY_DN3430_c0_g1_i1.p1  ORF type:complete len:236 (-),score=68.99 TRINITY_DN3430_c0_g1_i1:41-715(-)